MARPPRPRNIINPGRRINTRPELPIVERNPSTGPSLKLVLFIVGLVALAAFSTTGGFSGFDGTNSAYASQYEVSNINLTPGNVKNRTLWNISGQVMNVSAGSVKGPRLRIQLVRGDGTVAAEGVQDLAYQSLSERDTMRFDYRLETQAGETLSAVITPEPPREGAYDKP